MNRVLFLVVAMGCFLVGAFVARWRDEVRAQGAPHYRVIDENKGEKIEQAINEIVRQEPSCRPILGLSQSEYGTSKVIMECPGS